MYVMYTYTCEFIAFEAWPTFYFLFLGSSSEQKRETIEDLRARAAAQFGVDNGGLSNKTKATSVVEGAKELNHSFGIY